MNLSIGQGENAYTPAARWRDMWRLWRTTAHYMISTLTEIHFTRLTLGEEKNEGTKVENSYDDAFAVAREGMRLVANGSQGSARALFAEFPL